MAALARSLLSLCLALQLLCSASVSAQGEEEQEASCVSPDPIGFTALSPQQLRQEIKNAVETSLSGYLQGLTDSLLRSEASCSENLALVEEMLVELNYSLTKSQERFMQKLEDVMEESLRSRLEELVKNLTATFQNALDSSTSPSSPSPPTSSPLSALSHPPPAPPGLSSSHPALSCQQVRELTAPTASSGYYWVAGVGGSSDNLPRPVRVYCSMQQTCGDKDGGWMRVAHINMTNSSHSCPPGKDFVEWTRPFPPRRLCIPNSNASGCFSHHFPVVAVGAGVSKICGRILSYQNGTPNAFYPSHVHSTRTIDDVYVDGVSLTHGRSTRSHIWTFAAALDETVGHLSGCECSNDLQLTSGSVPSFVGRDYFCSTASRGKVRFRFYAEDPLWDGKGCGPRNSCCLFNSPPWFTKDLTNFPAGGTIEMRVCRDAGSENENIPFQLVELYVK